MAQVISMDRGGNMSYTEPYPSRRCGRDRLLEATEDGLLDPQSVLQMVARWMTSDEIYEMCDHNEINLARLTGD